MKMDPSLGIEEGGPLEQILALVAERRGIDFRDYRRDTVNRCVDRRQKARGCGNVAAYLSLVSSDRGEFDRLVEALVIPFTGFFRDPHVFRKLAAEVLPALTGGKSHVRAWVVGAASGEEAYTVAFLLAETAGQKRGVSFEVIASDLDERSVAVGREGLYPEPALEAVPPDFRARYFRREAGGMRVVDSIRGRVRFAQHDLMGTQLAPSEAVVASFEAVFCRNVLMYFDASLRVKALQRLAAVLEPQGALVLGVSESLPEGLAAQLEEHPAIGPGFGVFQRRNR
jgi:two-component system CheB/CheR fusion protein